MDNLTLQVTTHDPTTLKSINIVAKLIEVNNEAKTLVFEKTNGERNTLTFDVFNDRFLNPQVKLI